MREEQFKEAIKRLELLDVHPNVLAEFSEEGKLNKSEMGVLYWLDEEEAKMIKEWEDKTGNLVYHVIKSNTNIGLMYSLLYISKHKDEWGMDTEDLESNMPFVYVLNITNLDCSEYGSIQMEQACGGLRRIA